MRIHELVWPEDRVEHIARHGLTPDEVEEVCFGDVFVLRARSRGPNPVYHVLGRTGAGRHVLVVVIGFPDGRGFPVTARSMTSKERRLYERQRNR